MSVVAVPGHVTVPSMEEWKSKPMTQTGSSYRTRQTNFDKLIDVRLDSRPSDLKAWVIQQQRIHNGQMATVAGQGVSIPFTILHFSILGSSTLVDNKMGIITGTVERRRAASALCFNVCSVIQQLLPLE
jgi:hypothetical protein